MKEGNESVDNSETSDNLSDESIIKTKKKGSIDSTVEDYEFPISCNTLCDKYCSFVWGKMIELANLFFSRKIQIVGTCCYYTNDNSRVQ